MSVKNLLFSTYYKRYYHYINTSVNYELFTVHCVEVAVSVELGCVSLDCSGVASLL